jgi:hypothetical protein
MDLGVLALTQGYRKGNLSALIAGLAEDQTRDTRVARSGAKRLAIHYDHSGSYVRNKGPPHPFRQKSGTPYPFKNSPIN